VDLHKKQPVTVVNKSTRSFGTKLLVSRNPYLRPDPGYDGPGCPGPEPDDCGGSEEGDPDYTGNHVSSLHDSLSASFEYEWTLKNEATATSEIRISIHGHGSALPEL
jgi:hypothetical protein